jgi:hypothetical protein
MYMPGIFVPGVSIPFDPDDPHAYDPLDPANTGDDSYPEATINEFPIIDLPSHEEQVEINGQSATVDVYEVTGSFEFHCFEYVYTPRTISGVTHMVLVLRPKRWKKKKPASNHARQAEHV